MRELTDQTINSIREDFPSLHRSLNGQALRYFDGPGGSQVPEEVIAAVSNYYRSCNANTHGLFVTSRNSDEILDQARLAMADFLGAQGPGTISLGANMTTLNFSLSHALGRSFIPGDEILITALDHEANRGPWLGLREKGILVREVPVNDGGELDYAVMEKMVSSRTRLVAVGWASNALGTVNDIRFIRKITRRVGAMLLVDAVHYAPHFSIDVQAEDVDFLLCSAYKFYGPHVGILYSRPGLLEQLETDRLKTQDQAAPYRIETGTLNHAAIAGVAAAVNYLEKLGGGENRRARLVDAFHGISRYEFALGRRFIQGLYEHPKIKVYGPPMPEGPGGRTPTISFRIEGVTPPEACEQLGNKGFLVWDGDFYAARVIELLGLSDSGGVIRVGISLYTKMEEVEDLLEAVRQLS